MQHCAVSTLHALWTVVAARPTVGIAAKSAIWRVWASVTPVKTREKAPRPNGTTPIRSAKQLVSTQPHALQSVKAQSSTLATHIRLKRLAPVLPSENGSQTYCNAIGTTGQGAETNKNAQPQESVTTGNCRFGTMAVESKPLESVSGLGEQASRATAISTVAGMATHRLDAFSTAKTTRTDQWAHNSSASLLATPGTRKRTPQRSVWRTAKAAREVLGTTFLG